ncbi:cytidine deaminase [Maribellus comscasis]|uniref:Cytidine deaminase n=1 Tax=Maribellus comscasis TaxID=2681766 RepID=A0A6I6JY47_9BACT|nr:cytidine deaminase [Maribellus comscasis]QGY46269.1 cytidine deaminase [Maribellus comscasis]
MRKSELRIVHFEFDNIGELQKEDRELVLAARKASKNAYAPYSKFHVGAAIQLENGEIVNGNNQENSAFTSGLCAERTALFYANANFPDVAVKRIAVTAENSSGLVLDPVKPCGSCRQAMVETEMRFQKPIRIILDGDGKILVFDGVDSLLPFAFKPDSLD